MRQFANRARLFRPNFNFSVFFFQHRHRGFIHVLRTLALEAKTGQTARFEGAPHFAPRRRLDETLAARKPILRWKPAPLQEAAE